MTQDRQIRVFISSTFRDMMRERDVLVKEVFPELRRKCAKRFVTFTEVDLRWGITEDQANEGQVLPLCLAEIERSRPYFIGLLGERYGWIPDTIRPEVIEREPWLKEHVHGHTSVTELGILHGVLRDEAMHGHAYFYFRDPKFLEGLSTGQREVFATENAESAGKLNRLKQQIRHARDEQVCQVRENFRDVAQLSEWILEDFNRLIDRLYPEEQVPDPLAQERMAHEAHAKNKLFACIHRPAHLAVLNAFAAQAEHNGKGLVLTGESGGGKTALLAAWARDWAKDHPEDFLFQHYFGATPDSASPEGFLRRLLGEIKSRFGITEDIPTDPEKLRDALPVWLAQASATLTRPAGHPLPSDGRGAGGEGQGRIILVLDGLNQVQGSEPDRRLRFLPRHVPPQVVILASALPGPALDALCERGWTDHDLPRASQAEVDAMVGEYLKIHARTLEPALRHELVTAAGAKNPLFLRTILEELRQFGSFEQLPQRVRHYLEADNPRDLFLRVLTRWQEDFDAQDPAATSRAVQTPSPPSEGGEGRGEVGGAGEQGTPVPARNGAHDVVRRALTHLWAARQGLSESEWLDLLGSSLNSQPSTLNDSPLPRALWTPLFLALEPHLSQRAGLFAFGHDFLRQAVEAAFLPSEDLRRVAHLSIADYFERHQHQREMTPRKAAEWPHQLHAAQSWDRLETCLTHLPLFLLLYNDKSKWELTGYWHPLRRLSRDMGNTYAAACNRFLALPRNASDHFVPDQVGAFLHDNGLYGAAEPLLKRALEASDRVLGAEHHSTLASVHNLARLLRSKGDYAGAEPLHRRALEASERLLGAEHPFTLVSVNNLAELLERKGDYAGAEPLYRRALEARERVLGAEHPETLVSVNNLAGLLKSKGDYARAEPLYRRSLEASERVLGAEHPETLVSVNNLAVLLESKGDCAGAEPLYRRALEASERVLGAEHPDTLAIVNNLAGLLESKGDYAGAEPLYRRALEVHERVLGGEHPDTLGSVNNLAALLESKGDYAEAEPLYRRALEVRERVLGAEHPSTLISVNNLAALLESIGDYAGAEPLYRRALEASERVLGAEHPNTLVSVNNLAALLASKGDYAGAEPLYRRALEASERVLGAEHPNTLVSVNNLAALLESKGDYAEAEPLYRRALEASERVLGAEHPSTLISVNNLAALLESIGDYAGAEPLYRRALDGLVKVSRAIGRPHPHLQTCIDNYASCLERQGCTREQILAKRHELATEFFEATEPAPEPTAIDLNNRALDLRKAGRLAEAEPLLRQALEMDQNTRGAAHPKIPHRLNNLCTVLIMQGKLDEARPLLARAWQLKSGQHDLTSARLLFIRLTVALLESQPAATFLGQLKTLLAQDSLPDHADVNKNWDIAYFIEHLQPRLGERNARLLEALAAAMNDRSKLGTLDSFPEWRDQLSLSLDTHWPGE